MNDKNFISMDIPFFQTPNNIFEEFKIKDTKENTIRTLKSYEKLVLIYLCRCGNNGRAIFPGYSDIAKKCGISRRSAINAIDVLKNNNFITKEKRLKKDEKINASNQYTINLDLLMPKKSSAPGAPPSAPGALPLVHNMHHPSAPGAPKKELLINNNIKKIYSLVISYLNQKAGTKYKDTSKKTQQLINARLTEGFTKEDFYTVINNKVEEWKGTDMEKFLRPETLFGNKFEGYLNQKHIKPNKQQEKTNNNAYKPFEF